MGAARTAGLALCVALAGTAAVGAPALAEVAAPAVAAPAPSAPAPSAQAPSAQAPAASSVASIGTGTDEQSATIDPSAQLVDPDDEPVTDEALAAGQVSVLAGTITFDPAAGFTGSTTIVYRLTDAYGQTADGTYTPTVVIPSAPVAEPTTTRAAANLQQVATLPVPTDGSLTLVTPDGGSATHVYVPGEGNYAVDASTGTITFTPGQGFYGEGSLTYQLTDAYGQTSRSDYRPVVLRVMAQRGLVAPRHRALIQPQVVLVPPVELTKPVTTSNPEVREKAGPQHAPLHRAAGNGTAGGARVTRFGHKSAAARQSSTSTVNVATAPPAAAEPATATPATVQPAVAKPATAQLQAAPRATIAAGPAAAVVQHLVAAPASDAMPDLHNTGRLAGLALIVVNSGVLVLALALNRRRRAG